MLELMSEARKKLLELEKTGKYFFHGSSNDVEIFEPRQSHNDINGVLVPDGDPAVSATPAVDYAIVMAIINVKNCPRGCSSITNTTSDTKDAIDFKLEFLATKETIEQLDENSSGWVYIFKREDFPFRKDPSEYRSHIHVRPLERVLVKREDLPEVSELIM